MMKNQHQMPNKRKTIPLAQKIVRPAYHSCRGRYA